MTCGLLPRAIPPGDVTVRAAIPQRLLANSSILAAPSVARCSALAALARRWAYERCWTAV